LHDRKDGKSIPQIVEELRSQGINISHAQTLRIITLFQKEERAAQSHYDLAQTPEPLAVREDPPERTPHPQLKPSTKPPSKPKVSASNKTREEDLEKTIKQARRSAGKAHQSKLPSGKTERTKEGPGRLSPDH